MRHPSHALSLRAPLLVTLAGLALGSAAQAEPIAIGGPTSLATPQRPDGVAIADLNGDGRNDLAVVTDTPDKVTLFFSTGNGQFGPAQQIQLPSSSSPGKLAAADFNADGRIDLAVILKDLNQVRVINNLGGGSFTLGASAPVGSEAVDIQVADLNGDGRPDLATANRDGNSFSILLNTGSGFGATTVPAGTEPRAVALADIDGDGDRDLAITLHRDRTVSWFRNSGAGAFTIAQTLSVGGSFRAEGVALADLTGDQLPEIVTVADNDGPGFVQVFLNAGGSFAGHINYPTQGIDPADIRLADLDGDGDLDAVVTHETSNNVAVLPGRPGGTFGPSALLAAGAHPDSLALGRVDGDTMIDIVVTNRDSNTTMWWRNTTTPPVTGCNPDVNQDGNVDQDDVAYLINVAAGGSNPSNVDPDFNQDGNVDQSDVAFLINVVAGGACP